MINEHVYDIWLQQALKYGSRKPKIIKAHYPKISDFYGSTEHDWRLLGCLTNKEIENLKKMDLGKAIAIAQKCYNRGYNILTLSDPDYSYLLSQIDDPPCVLYVKGDTLCLNAQLPIAIVGTRSASVFGEETAREISRGLVRSNATIVSGGALGIDSAAHRAALDAGGKTIAVLGCGIGFPYLKSNEWLREKISLSGAIVSEYEPDFRSYPFNFPARNRIISGLCLGTLVVEAGERSGSLITANLASNQNRDVFAVALSSNDPKMQGVDSLIRDGAKVVDSAKDIVAEYFCKANATLKKDFAAYSYLTPKLIKGESKTTPQEQKSVTDRPNESCAIQKLLPNEKAVFEVIKNQKVHIDDISVKTEIPIHKLLPILTELELLGVVRALPGKMYFAESDI